MYAEIMRIRLRVKEVATQKQMSMTRLHIKSEVAYNAIRRIFRDPYAEVSTTTLTKLANALGVPPSLLIEDVPDDTDEEKEKNLLITPNSSQD